MAHTRSVRCAYLTHFTSGTDRIDLTGFGPGIGFVGTASFSGSGAELRFDLGARQLQLDADGDGTTDFAIRLSGVSSLLQGDLILA